MGALAALLAPLCPVVGMLAPVPASAQAAPVAPVVVIEGRGFGHGVGMAQDGAFAMASAGASAKAILSHFYPGTSIARRAATVRVGVHQSPGPVVVALPGGGEVRDAPGGAQSLGFPVTVSPGGSVQLSFDGSTYRATPLAGAAISRVATAPAPPVHVAPPPPTTVPRTTTPTNLLDPLLGALLPTTVPPTAAGAAAPIATVVPATQKDAQSSRGLFAVPRGGSLVSLPGPGRSYRGTMEASGAGRGLNMTNIVDVEQYVRGMGEMPASWPAAALQAQAIAARTFAVRAALAGTTLCDDQQCQVYIGANNEHPATSAAATATLGQVLTYQGALAEAVYSASAGGMTATPKEGFGPGSPDIPYLNPVPYTVSDPQLWAMTLPLREAGARFGYRGEVTDIRVASVGPSGRPLDVTFHGSNGPMAVDGHRFWAELKLRSTLFTVRTEGTPPAVEGAPFATRVAGEAPPSGDDPVIAAAGPPAVAAESLGRAPWVGLALLLLAVWATMASRMPGRRVAPPTVPAEPSAAAGDAPDEADEEDEARRPSSRLPLFRPR